MLTLWEIFNCTDGRTVEMIRADERGAIEYATVRGHSYDCSRAEPGFYVSRNDGRQTDYLLERHPLRLKAQGRADFENMASDRYSFAIVEVRA